jgi:DNA-binding CsgD family transcriptional regulator
MLQQSHDRLELARALADLGDTYHAQGDRTRARIMVRRAHHLAKQCGAGAILDTLPLDVNLDGNEEEPGTGYDVAASELTDAERRVASLAAQGQTNREIAARLYITVSTVEQHLTRVYKKLNVSRRSDLPPGLWLESQEGRWMT